MTVLSEKVLHCCRGSDSSNELTPEEGGEVAEPKMIQKTEKEYSSYVTLQDNTEVLHPKTQSITSGQMQRLVVFSL